VSDAQIANLDDEAVRSGNRMVDVDGNDAKARVGEIYLAAGAQKAPVEVAEVGLPVSLAGLEADINEFLCIDARYYGRPGGEERGVADVIEVGMRDDRGVAVRAWSVAIKAGNIGDGADGEQAGDMEGLVPRRL